MVERFTKTNSEVLDYAFNFAPSSPWLANSETLSIATIVTDPSSQLGIDSITNTGSSVLLFVGSGGIGNVYCVTALVTTSLGRQAARTFEISVIAKR